MTAEGGTARLLVTMIFEKPCTRQFVVRTYIG